MMKKTYDKESGEGYKSVPLRHKNSDASWDVENWLSTWILEFSDAQLSEDV